jgi:hypothetical protein
VVNKRLHAWRQADEENYMRSSEKIREHMQEFHSCMTECDRIDLALAKLSNFQEAELSGSTKQDCNLEEKLKQEEPEARNNVNETLEENKPCEAAAGSDELESAQAEKKLSGVDSKTTHCLEEKLQGKLLHYRELKQDLVVILDWYKKQIEAAQDYLENSWGDAYRKVIVDIKWLRKEVRKLRRRHNQACRDFDNAVRRLHALERVVTVQPYMFKSRPAKHSPNKTSGNIKPVVSQSLRLHSYKGAVRTRRNMKNTLGKWTGSSAYQSCGNHLRQGYSNAWTYGCC